MFGKCAWSLLSIQGKAWGLRGIMKFMLQNTLTTIACDLDVNCLPTCASRVMVIVFSHNFIASGLKHTTWGIGLGGYFRLCSSRAGVSGFFVWLVIHRTRPEIAKTTVHVTLGNTTEMHVGRKLPNLLQPDPRPTTNYKLSTTQHNQHAHTHTQRHKDTKT